MTYSRSIQAFVDSITPTLSGWAGFAHGSEEPATGLIQASLLIDSTPIGFLKRDGVRTDVDDHLGYESEPKGFSLDLSPIANFVTAHEHGARLKLLFQGSDAPDAEYDLQLAGLTGDPASLRGSQSGWEVRDCWFGTTRRLMIRVDCKAGRAAPAVRAFQYDPQRSDALVRLPVGGAMGEIGILDMELLNPFQPVLLVMVDASETIIGSEWLPFPSLARGGLHDAEVNAVGSLGDPFHNLLALWRRLASALRSLRTGDFDDQVRCGRLVIHIDDATGTEPIYDRDLLDFITGFLGVQVLVEGAEGPGGEPSAGPVPKITPPTVGFSDTHATLHLSAYAVPTLQVLVEPLARGAGPVSGRLAYICNLPAPEAASWLVTPPRETGESDETVQALPRLVLNDPQSGRCGPRGPAVIVYPAALTRMRPSVAFPMATDSLERASSPVGRSAVSAVVHAVPGRDVPVALLQSLAAQSQFETGELIYGVGSEEARDAARPVLDSLFPDRHTVVILDDGQASRRGRFQTLSRHAANPNLLLLDPDAVLHDTQTLGRLSDQLTDPLTGSAGSRLIPMASGGKDGGTGGYFLSGISLRQMPSLEFDLPDTRRILDRRYWVVASPMVALAIRGDVLARLSEAVQAQASAGAEDVAFGLDIMALGLANVVLGDLAVTFAAPQVRQLGYPVAMPWALDVSLVEQVMRRSTGLQRL